MTMNKFFAGLIAFVAGVALSAGSAFATNGYTWAATPAMIKLVPYYETGDTERPLSVFQNMSSARDATHDCEYACYGYSALETATATAAADPAVSEDW